MHRASGKREILLEAAMSAGESKEICVLTAYGIVTGKLQREVLAWAEKYFLVENGSIHGAAGRIDFVEFAIFYDGVIGYSFRDPGQTQPRAVAEYNA